MKGLAGRPALVAVTILWLAGLLVSGRHPFDRATWVMEVAPVLLVLPILWFRRLGGRLTPLALWLVCLHGFVLMLGGAYSYARVPAGFVVQDWLGLGRNPYDRFGHLMQGFVPAIVLREWLLRADAVRRPFLSPLLLACCLGISAAYELVEFGAAMWLGQGADAFLGTQGDVWDTHWDMLMCLVGAALALVFLSRLHDLQLGRRQNYPSAIPP